MVFGSEKSNLLKRKKPIKRLFSTVPILLVFNIVLLNGLSPFDNDGWYNTTNIVEGRGGYYKVT